MKLIVKRGAAPKGEIKISGDKSITHRAFLISSLAQGKSAITGYSRCADCMATLNIIEKLGASIEERGSSIYIGGRGHMGFSEPDDALDCGNSGTTMRLFAGVLSGQRFFSVLTGDSSLRKRPMDRIVKPLSMMGAHIHARNGGKFAPLCIIGSPLRSVQYALPVASAQVKSSILLAGLHAQGETCVREPCPTRNHTELMLNFFGAEISDKNARIVIKGRVKLEAKNIAIPGDISSAAYFIALGTIMPQSELILNEIGINPTRTGILDVLKMMGAHISFSNCNTVSNESIADLVINHARLKGTKISGRLIPRLIDEIPIIAVVATQAEGITEIKDAAELRVKETDRITAIVNGLIKMGAKIEEREDGLVVKGPTRLQGTSCTSFGDHRIAMALTIAGLIADGETTIDDAGCIDVSFPEFTTNLRAVCDEKCITAKN